MPAAAPEILTSLLEEGSRSFYLTLRILPASIRPQIGLAYLLARATDTIADTEIIPVPVRLQGLKALRERILGQTQAALDRSAIRVCAAGGERPNAVSGVHVGASQAGRPASGSAAERLILQRIEEVVRLLSTFSEADQKRIRRVIEIITSGQSLDLERFAGATSERIVGLDTEQELDDYTYRVAGSVGEFWTVMCRAHIFPEAPLDDAALLENGIRFGKGLQLVNILRDLPVDLRQGRCYLPAESLKRHGLATQDLINAANEVRFRPLYASFLSQAEAHLAAGWAYTK